MKGKLLMLPLAVSTWGEEDLLAAEVVLRSGQTTMGPVTQEFESNFAEYVGARYAVMVNSGSSANLLALSALELHRQKNGSNFEKSDLEVIVPAVSWPTTFYPINQLGLKLVFVDVDPFTFNLDVNLVASAINDRTVGIVGVNVLGTIADWAELRKLANDAKVWLFEDNCESLGAVEGGKQAGTFGDCGTFSFFFSHHISTMEGGMVVTDNEELYRILLMMRAHGWQRELGREKSTLDSYELWKEKFTFLVPGFNFRPTEVQAAIGLTQLLKLPKFLEQRRKNAKSFIRAVDGIGEIRMQKHVEESSWFGFAFIAETDRKSLVLALANNGIDSRPIIAGNFLRQPVIKHLNHRVDSAMQNADLIHNNGFFIGNHHLDYAKEYEQVAEILRKVTQR